MIKNVIIISTILLAASIQIHGKSINNPSSITTSSNRNLFSSNKFEVPNDKEKIEHFWNDENIGFLNSDELRILNDLKDKIQSGENLTVEERGIISELRCNTIKKKLGEERYERYKKLIEKREKQEKGKLEIEMTKEEKREIYLFEKEISGKK